MTSPLWRLVSKKAKSIVVFNDNADSVAFYCVHPIFGDVTSFYDLAISLGSEQHFCGIQVPKEKANSIFASSIEVIAQHHVEALAAFQPEGPLVLGGWSAGAIIALEMAQRLRAVGRDVLLLIAFDGAPCNTGAGISRWNPLYGWKLICNLPGWIKWEMRQNKSVYAFVRQMTKKATYRAHMTLPRIKTEQTLYGAAVQNLLDEPQHTSGQMHFVRALYDAMRTYVPKPYPGRVLVFEAKTQPLSHLLQVGAAWKSIAELLEIIQLEGNHFSIFQKPAVQIVADHLHVRLAELSLCK